MVIDYGSASKVRSFRLPEKLWDRINKFKDACNKDKGGYWEIGASESVRRLLSDALKRWEDEQKPSKSKKKK